jgi:hypothetical protein
VLADNTDASPPVSADRLHELGYFSPGWADAQAAASADAREAIMLTGRARWLPQADAEAS